MTPPAPPSEVENRAPWIVIVGCAAAFIGLFFLMAVYLFTVFGKRIDCGDAFIISLIFGLCLGMSSAFLGGYGAITGNISLPLLGNQPLVVALTGGLAFLGIGCGIGYLITKGECSDPPRTLTQFFRGEIKDIPIGFDLVPEGKGYFYTSRERYDCQNAEAKDDGTPIECYKQDFLFDSNTPDLDVKLALYDKRADHSGQPSFLVVDRGTPLPEQGQITEVWGPIDMTQSVQVTLEPQLETSEPDPLSAKKPSLNGFELSTADKRDIYNLPIKNAPKTYRFGVDLEGQKLVLVKLQDSSSAQSVPKSIAAGPVHGYEPSRLSPPDNAPAIASAPAATTTSLLLSALKSDDATTRTTARQILLGQFDLYKDIIWQAISSTDDKLVAQLISLINAHYKAAEPASNTLGDAVDLVVSTMPAEGMKKVVSLAITSDDSDVREQARQFLRSFPADQVTADFVETTKNIIPDPATPATDGGTPSPCKPEDTFLCRRAAYAGIYLYYDRIALRILQGDHTSADVLYSRENFEAARRLEPYLTDSAKIDIVAPYFGFSYILYFAERNHNVPKEVSATYNSSDLWKKILEIASANDEYYAFPHHIYLPLAGLSATPTASDPPFLKLLKDTNTGSKVTDYKSGPSRDLTGMDRVFTGPSEQNYSAQQLKGAASGTVLSRFGDWEFLRIRDNKNSTIGFGWMKAPTQTG